MRHETTRRDSRRWRQHPPLLRRLSGGSADAGCGQRGRGGDGPAVRAYNHETSRSQRTDHPIADRVAPVLNDDKPSTQSPWIAFPRCVSRGDVLYDRLPAQRAWLRLGQSNKERLKSASQSGRRRTRTQIPPAGRSVCGICGPGVLVQGQRPWRSMCIQRRQEPVPLMVGDALEP